MENGEVIVETDMDFKPIEHPPEPPEEDLPIKCPIPDALSLIVSSSLVPFRIWELVHLF